MSEPLIVCRWCSVCEGMAHHWMEEPTLTKDYVCKHCPAIGRVCDACEGGDEADQDCPICQGDGVIRCGALLFCDNCGEIGDDDVSVGRLDCGHALCTECTCEEIPCPLCRLTHTTTP